MALLMHPSWFTKRCQTFNGTRLHHICQSLQKLAGRDAMAEHNQLNIVCPNNRLQVGRHAGQIRLKIHRASEILRAAAKGNMEKDSVRTDQIRTQTGKNQPAKKYRLIHRQLPPKRGDKTGYDGFRKILGTKIHVAVDGTGLPISIRASPANVHDSTKFIDVLENISELTGDDLIRQIISAYADKGYDAACIRDYLRSHGIDCCIPYKRNSRNVAQNRNQRHHGKAGFVVERFLAWLKCGLHRTAVRYERNCDDCLGFVYLACVMMYWRVLRISSI